MYSYPVGPMHTIPNELKNLSIFISLSTVYFIVGFGQKSYGFQKFCALKINLAIGFIQKILLECIG